MNRRFALAAATVLLAACAGVRPSATPGPAAGSSAPSARPSTFPSPTVVGTVTPSSVPPRIYVPGSTQPPELGTRTLDFAKDVYVIVVVDRVPLVAGEKVDLTLRIENRGSRSVYWISDSCGNPGLTYVHLNGEAWVGGVSQTGIAATFKAFALEPFGHAGHTQLAIGLPGDFPPEGAGCADVGISHELDPGARLERPRHWTGDTEDPIPEGPADIVAEFEFWPDVEFDRESKTVLEARIPTWIESNDVVDYLPPGPAIDAALADPEFRDWLEAADTTGWVNSSHTLDLEAGTWEIGLFRDGGPGFYGEVTLDARTGEVLGHRFE